MWAGYSAPRQYPQAAPAPCPNDRQDAGRLGSCSGSSARAWPCYCDIFRFNSTCLDEISGGVDENHSEWHESAIEGVHNGPTRSEEHTSELQSLMRISYAVFCLK